MKKMIAVFVIMTASLPAFAAIGDPTGTIPEPGVLALMGAAAIAFFISRRMKK